MSCVQLLSEKILNMFLSIDFPNNLNNQKNLNNTCKSSLDRTYSFHKSLFKAAASLRALSTYICMLTTAPRRNICSSQSLAISANSIRFRFSPFRLVWVLRIPCLKRNFRHATILPPVCVCVRSPVFIVPMNQPYVS